MLFDAHCHIGTDTDPGLIDELVRKYESEDELKLVLMSTNQIDLEYVIKFAELNNVTPCFGVHPWYSHMFTLMEEGKIDKEEHYRMVFGVKDGVEMDLELMNNLPKPINFTNHMEKIVGMVKKYKRMCLIGEIGLDKLFRIPNCGFYSNPTYTLEGSKEIRLTNYKTKMEHQKQVFIRQLHIAIEYNLSISVHNVKTSGVIYDILNKYITKEYLGGICLHSYTGSIETLELFIKTFKKNRSMQCKFFISLSCFINNKEDKIEELKKILGIIPDDSVLIETDMTIENVNPRSQLEHIRQVIMKYKGWNNDEQLVDNYYKLIGYCH